MGGLAPNPVLRAECGEGFIVVEADVAREGHAFGCYGAANVLCSGAAALESYLGMRGVDSHQRYMR